MVNQYTLRNILLSSSSFETRESATPFISSEISEISYDFKLSDQSSLVLSSSKEILLPLSILKNNSSLEAIVKYLKEILNLKYSEIALLLNRNQRTIWVTYANSKKKNVLLDLDNSSEIFLPLNVFISRRFSILEAIVFYLKVNRALSFNQISLLLGKNYQTIWTIYRRLIVKLDMKKFEELNNN